jgi:hypothetical protein
MIAQMSVRIPLALKTLWRALYFYCSLYYFFIKKKLTKALYQVFILHIIQFMVCMISAIPSVYPTHYTVYRVYDKRYT